jgi:flagellar hook assembly protein FlgD
MNPSTRISFELPAPGPVSIKIYDVGGRLIRNLLEGGSLEAGRHSVHWDGRNSAGKPMGSGIYYIRLEAESGKDTGSITLLR